VTAPDPLRDALAAVVGAAHVLTEAAERSAYETGFRYGQGTARAVVRPGSRDEVAAVLRIAVAAGIPVVPQGANTGLVGASNPDASGQQIVLSLARLNRTIEIDLVNRSVTVDAGVRMSQLDAALEPHGLCFPIDLGADPTIGGMIAANTGGARLLRYGDVRRNLLGLEAVLADADGRVLSDLRGVRKDNTGLDWKQIFVGTGGSFGVVTRAVLQLAPRPLQSATALLVPADAAQVTVLLTALERSCGDFLASFEHLSRAAMETVFRHVPSVPRPFAGATPETALLLELVSTLPVARLDLEALLAAELEPHLESGLLADAYLGKAESFWALRHAISEALRHAGEVVAFDLALPRSRVDAFRTEAAALLAARYPEALLCDFGHRGDGGEHFNLVWPRDAARKLDETRQALRDDVYALIVAHDGSFSAEHGIGPHNQLYYDRYTGAAQRAVAACLKAELDPAALLGRTRL
jgi:FAD/FMN-containing dehydrogenase